MTVHGSDSSSESRSERHLALVGADAKPAKRGSPGKRHATRHRLLDACAAVIVRAGLRGVSMTAIAEEAGITRQTVYRYFANADELVAATMLRTGREIQEACLMILREEGDPRDQVVDAAMMAHRLLVQSKLIARAWESDEFRSVMFHTATDDSVLGRAVEGMRPLGARCGWDDDEIRLVFDVIARTVISFLTIPPADSSDSGLRAILYRRLLPAIGL